MRKMMKETGIETGDRVRVIRLPERLNGMPEETVRLFRQCVGKSFPVAGIGPYGHLEIRVADEIGGAFRKKNDTIWIEPECVEQI